MVQLNNENIIKFAFVPGYIDRIAKRSFSQQISFLDQRQFFSTISSIFSPFCESQKTENDFFVKKETKENKKVYFVQKLS